MTATRRAFRIAPRAMDPVLALVEHVDRRLRRIRAVAPGSVLGIERARHRHGDLALPHGAWIRAGDQVWAIHLDNARLRELADEAWPTRAYEAARADLRMLAAGLSRMPPGERPVALGGITLLAALARRLGFAVASRRRTARVRLEDWYLRSLLARWAPSGRKRLTRGHGELRTSSAWISTDELLRRYGPPPE